MILTTHLILAGYAGEPVQNTFLRHEEAGQHLAIMFPGAEYGIHAPILSDLRQALLARGADLLQVEYVYRAWANLTEAERFKRLYAAVEAAAEAGLAQQDYRAVTLVGKSVGTLAVEHLLQTIHWPAPPQVIWLTPLLLSDRLRQRIQAKPHRSLFVIGTADRHYKPDLLAQVLAASGGQALVLPGADHSLAIPGDEPASLRAREEIRSAANAFLDNGAGVE